MNIPLYASDLACSAASLPPKGTEHQGPDTSCCMCGRPIVNGTPSAPRAFPRTFSDHETLSPSEHACGWCLAITPQNILRAFQRAVITRDGVYNLNKDEARAWFWLTPPDPPFVAVIHNGSALAAFHYVWRTPVTLDKRLIAVNFDGVIAHVRHEAILRSVEMLETLKEHAVREGHKKGLNSPFKLLNRASFTSSSNGHGQLNEITQTLALKYESCAKAAQFFSSLSNSELTALSAILKANPTPPVHPQLLAGSSLFD